MSIELIKKLKSRALRWSLPKPFECRHIEYSTISCVDDEPSHPTEWLIDLSLRAISEARICDLSWISKRIAESDTSSGRTDLSWVAPGVNTHIPWPEIWPGEHYRLLAGLVAVHKPRVVIEIGTLAGWGTLALRHSLPHDAELLTFDLVPWEDIPGTAFKKCDFQDGRIKQILGDLSAPDFFKEHAQTISSCDLLFVDAPKNVAFETTLLRHLETIQLPKDAVVIFDDTRNWNMLKIWREIRRPKLDLTSFGHWTGTGIIHWNGSINS